MKAYIDSDILIWHLRGQRKALCFFQELDRANEYELWIGAMQRAEVMFFIRPAEGEDTRLFLTRFKTAPLDEGLVDAAAALYRNWHKSHDVDINDAFLAATARHTGGVIFSLNIKHYPMPDIVVKKPW